jgi:hypothetical protein
MRKKLLNTLLLIALVASNAISQTATLTPLLEIDGAAITSISTNGKWACGSTFNNNDGAGYQSNASKWNLETGERTYLVTEDESNAQSDAFAITNDGSLIVGQYLYQPAYYTKGAWHTLELTQGYTIGEARDVAIVNGDTIIVGRIFDGDGYQKVQSAKWVNGKFEKLTNLIPREYQYNEDNKMANQILGISDDGRTLLGSFDPFTWPLRKPFIIRDSTFTILDIQGREEFANYHANFDFFKEEKLDHKGKYVALTFFSNTHIPCVYDIENDKFIVMTTAPYETGCKAVDENGNAYYAGPVTTGIDRKSYVTIQDRPVEVDNILRNAYGITQDQINATCTDPDLTGSIRYIYDVAADGKTLIGSAGYGTGGYNWVLSLSHSLFEIGYDPKTNIENNTAFTKVVAFYNLGKINIIGDADYVEIYNISGSLVEKNKVENSTIDTYLNNGVYIVKLYKNNIIANTNKLIIK